MADSTVRSLLGAVRRRMWRSEFVAATRLALWGTAGLMLLAVAVHLAVRPVRVGVVLWAIAVLWVAMMARAGLRRPLDSSCALWVDRHLGGASAFSTLLEMTNGAPAGVPRAPGLRWLEHWARARVPLSLRLLEERRDPTGLSRPLLSMLVCTAFATVVLTLPDSASPSRQPFAMSKPSSISDRPMPDANPSVVTELVGELTHALRAAESHPPDGREVGRAPAARSGKSGDSTGSEVTQSGAATPGERATIGKSTGGSSVDAAPAGATPASSASSGRDAGDSPDDRADAGTSQVPRSTMPLERRESSARRRSPEQQADMDQLATFDEDIPMPRTAKVQDHAPAAATPPLATETTQLTPSQAAYVQAWIRASGQRR
jgi:hypothetical protein